MIEIVTEFEVKEEARGRFELAYGPGGAWSELLAGCPGFRGITLLRDTTNPCRYLAIELWDTVSQRQEMLIERRIEYASLEASLAGWAESQIEQGVFRVLAESAVRPRGGARSGRAGGARRRRR